MRAGLFCETDLIKEVAESCLRVVLEDSHVLNVGVGYLFFSAGQIGGELFLLEKGSVQTYRICGDKKIAITTLQPPRGFWGNGLLRPGYLSAESVEDSQVRLISGNTIQAMMECSPNLAHAVIGLIGE